MSEHPERSESSSLPIERAPLGGTAYVTCPDHPEPCSHPKGECPADKQAKEKHVASFKRIS